MALTTQEIESLRFHMGYGNIGVAAEPYTPDTFYEVFNSIVAPNLGTGTETSSVTAVSAGAVSTITVATIGDIVVNAQLAVDNAEQAEVVTVKAVSGSTVTAYFAKAHAASGYPVALMSGTARLRMLLGQADRSWDRLTDFGIAEEAGLKSVDKGDVVWFGGFQVLKDRIFHYKKIVSSISSLIRVQYIWPFDEARGGRLEAY